MNNIYFDDLYVSVLVSIPELSIFSIEMDDPRSLENNPSPLLKFIKFPGRYVIELESYAVVNNSDSDGPIDVYSFDVTYDGNTLEVI